LDKNYENKLWALIYEQYDKSSDRGELEYVFYLNEIKDIKGKVLEIACGTGSKFLKYLENGVDIYGFDISKEMLEILYQKGFEKGFSNIKEIITQQNMANFSYPFKFSKILIPARSFLHLTTQEDQINALKNIYDHLEDKGQLILNFFKPNLKSLVTKTEEYDFFEEFINPNNNEKIKLSFKNQVDLLKQIIAIDWKFETEGKEYHSEMKVRWIYKPEFELLLKLTGFNNVKVYGNFDKTPVTKESNELIWIAEK
jgi:SAM-dependent methyltransferase